MYKSFPNSIWRSLRKWESFINNVDSSTQTWVSTTCSIGRIKCISLTFLNQWNMTILMLWTFWEETFSTSMSFSEEKKSMSSEIGTFSNSLSPWVFQKENRNKNLKESSMILFIANKKMRKTKMKTMTEKHKRKNHKQKSKIWFSKEFLSQDCSETCHFKKSRKKSLRSLTMSQSLWRQLQASKKITGATNSMKNFWRPRKEWSRRSSKKMMTIVSHKEVRLHQTQMKKTPDLNNQKKENLNRPRKKLEDFKNTMGSLKLKENTKLRRIREKKEKIRSLKRWREKWPNEIEDSYLIMWFIFIYWRKHSLTSWILNFP